MFKNNIENLKKGEIIKKIKKKVIDKKKKKNIIEEEDDYNIDINIKIVICITIYNESRELLEETEKSIINDMNIFIENGISPQ